MSSQIPITLKGPNLGARHRYLNSLVSDAYSVGDPIDATLDLPEASHVDRLFKIDLASKHKHLQYILQNLQDDDMLFVSRALKAKWLLHEEYRQTISPSHLENVLYPNMLTTAVNKMKHWIHLNLRDPVRCQEFYMYYFKKDYDYAFKFLSKCPAETILNEFPKPTTLEKITPQRLKLLCEKVPAVAKLYYTMLRSNFSLVSKDSQILHKYFDCIKCILKTDPDTYLDITEQYFMPEYHKLSANSTAFILTNRKDRFMQKPELYTSQILHVSTIAQHLSPEECENLVIVLARAQYLEGWFTYENVEPLVKKLHFTKRASFKKKVFVDKDVGDVVLQWPYDKPEALFHLTTEDADYSKGVFLREYEPDNICDGIGEPIKPIPRVLLRGGGGPMHARVYTGKTLLDTLFDDYRFTSFQKTLFELRKKIKSESSSQNRMYMLLVLVSKSGGKSDHLVALFHLLMEHKNEPIHVRAAIIRSLVKRAFVWRVTDNLWKDLLMFGRGLGLDGTAPEADCNEGLHAVVIRCLLSNQECEPAVEKAFLKNFSTLVVYPLLTTEREHLKDALMTTLIKSANAEVDAKSKAQIIGYAIDCIQTFKIKFNNQPDVIIAIKNLAKDNAAAAKCLLERLFRSKLGRRELYRENFDLIQTDASYVNALKHDVSILSVDKFLEAVVSKELHAEQFLKKMSVYFLGKDDLAGCFLRAFNDTEKHKNLARPITYLIGDDLKSYMLQLDNKDEECKRFSALVRANAHVARPTLDINTFEWKKAGAKLISNKVTICKAKDVDPLIKKLLTWKKTVRLAIILGQRTSYKADVFASAAEIRPTATLTSALAYFRQQKDQSVLMVWEVVKPLIKKTESSIKTNPHLLRNIRNADSIPLSIKPEYLTEAFKVISKIDFKKSMGLLCRINNNFLKVDESFIEDVLVNFRQDRFVLDKITSEFDDNKIVSLHLRILVKYLLFCTTAEVQNERFHRVGQMYLDQLKSYWETTNDKKVFIGHYVNTLILSLRNTEAFSNNEFVSCLPVLEKFADWLRSVISVEENFLIIAPLHLTMLYYKAVRQAVEHMPGLLDEQKRLGEAYKIIGETFGKYIAKEARVLTIIYFDSIIIPYALALTKFFDGYINTNWPKMAIHVVKAIVDASTGIECTLALHLYKNIEYKDLIRCDRQVKSDINHCFKRKDSCEMQFCYQSWEIPRNYCWSKYNSLLRKYHRHQITVEKHCSFAGNDL